MRSIFLRYLAFIATLSLVTALPGQSIMEFIGEWTGTESLFSQVETYDSKDILVNISDGGNREGF